MNTYQEEQLEAISLIFRHLSRISVQEREKLRQEISDYLSFRQEVDAFLSKYFGDICTKKCYRNQRSACCSREGIITFFADTAVNVLLSREDEVKSLMTVLQKPNTGFKCIYLGNQGCMWRVKPIVCEMFLCKQAKTAVFKESPGTEDAWKKLNQLKKRFTWPDRPIVFDAIERYFMDAGYSSSLMYMHNSPGLLKVKEMARKSRKK